MFAFLFTFFAMFAETGGGGGLQGFYNNYLNIPGFEAWKFVNLTIFVLILVYIANKPLSQAFKAKRERIRADLIKAEAEKQAALAELTSAEAKLIALEQEKATVTQRAADEAAAERRRIEEEAAAEEQRIRQQASGDISRTASQARAELRRLAANESIRLAEEKLRGKITPETDARLIRSGIDAIGGAR